MTLSTTMRTRRTTSWTESRSSSSNRNDAAPDRLLRNCAKARCVREGVALPMEGRAASRHAATVTGVRSILAVRAKRLATLALGILAVGGLPTSPAVAHRASETSNAGTLGPVHVRPRAHAAAAHGPTVTAALASLLHGAAIDEAVYHQDYSAYVAAKSSLAKLIGTRKT